MATKRSHGEWMAAKRKSDPEFAERQRAAKRKWYRENSMRYKFDVKVWRNNNRKKVCAYTRKWRFGITQEQFDAKFESQNSSCAICKTRETRRWNIDHDHSCCPGERVCGKCIRGILCEPCNQMLGKVKDSAETLQRAIEYLAAHKKSLKQPLAPSESTTTTRPDMALISV